MVTLTREYVQTHCNLASWWDGGWGSNCYLVLVNNNKNNGLLIFCHCWQLKKQQRHRHTWSKLWLNWINSYSNFPLMSRGVCNYEIRRRKKETTIHSVSVTKCLNSWTQLSYAKFIPVIFGIVLFPPISLVQFVPIHPITLVQTEPSQANSCVTWTTVWTRNSLYLWNRLNIHKFKEYA